MKHFFKSYFLFILLLLDLSAIILSKVDFILIEYQDNVPETYIYNTLNNLSSSSLLSYFNYNSTYEKKGDAINNIKNYLNKQKYTITKKANLFYSIKSNDNEIMNIKLKTGEEKTKLSMLTYKVIDSCQITKLNNNSLYKVTIIVPSNYKVTINGINVNEKDLVKQEKIDGLEDLYNYIEVPYLNEYEIKDLTKEPNIIIKDENNKDLKVCIKDNKIDLSNNFPKYSSLKEANVDYDIMNFVTNWSLFSTNDLQGVNHGLYSILPYFISNSMLYKHTVNYAYSNSLNYINAHSLSNPIFQNSKVGNVIKYNDNAYSVDVYIEKNLLLLDGKILVDPFNNTVYIGRYNNSWYIIGMKAIV